MNSISEYKKLEQLSEGSLRYEQTARDAEDGLRLAKQSLRISLVTGIISILLSLGALLAVYSHYF